jgi:hypothetical protein
MGGRMEGIRFESIDFPVPGGPMRRMLWSISPVMVKPTVIIPTTDNGIAASYRVGSNRLRFRRIPYGIEWLHLHGMVVSDLNESRENTGPDPKTLLRAPKSIRNSITA